VGALSRRLPEAVMIANFSQFEALSKALTAWVAFRKYHGIHSQEARTLIGCAAPVWSLLNDEPWGKVASEWLIVLDIRERNADDPAKRRVVDALLEFVERELADTILQQLRPAPDLPKDVELAEMSRSSAANEAAL
jgi:hypothetical protein